MVHTEIILESDGGEGLGSRLDFHIFLCLDSLMETIAPAASFHDTSCLLIDNLDLTVLNDVVDFLVEHRIGLQELCHSVDAL